MKNIKKLKDLNNGIFSEINITASEIQDEFLMEELSNIKYDIIEK